MLNKKFELIGLHSKTLQFLSNYLENRVLIVMIGQSLSSPFIAVVGIPQESFVKPLMFKIFINDLPKVVLDSSCLLYANDLKIYETISNVNKIYDQFKWQDDNNHVARWCRDNGLILNSEKCSTNTFTIKNNDNPFDYYISNTLAKVNTIKDLGIIYDSKLNFQEHIDKVYCEWVPDSKIFTPVTFGR